MDTPSKLIYCHNRTLQESASGRLYAPAMSAPGNRHGQIEYVLANWERVQPVDRAYVAQAIVRGGGALTTIPDYRPTFWRGTTTTVTQYCCGHSTEIESFDFSRAPIPGRAVIATDLSDWYEITQTIEPATVTVVSANDCEKCAREKLMRTSCPYYDLTDAEIFAAIPALQHLSGGRTGRGLLAIREMAAPVPPLRDFRIVHKSSGYAAKNQIKLGYTNGRSGFCKSADFLAW